MSVVFLNGPVCNCVHETKCLSIQPVLISIAAAAIKFFYGGPHGIRLDPFYRGSRDRMTPYGPYGDPRKKFYRGSRDRIKCSQGARTDDRLIFIAAKCYVMQKTTIWPQSTVASGETFREMEMRRVHRGHEPSSTFPLSTSTLSVCIHSH